MLLFQRVDAGAQRFDFGKKVLKLARPYSDRPLQSPHDIGQSERDIDEDASRAISPMRPTLESASLTPLACVAAQ
jgi:hypothetical protein